MIIERITTHAIRVPLPRVFYGSNYAYTHKKAMTIEIECSDGLVGQAYLGDDFGLGSAAASLAGGAMSDSLIGKDSSNIANLWQSLRPFARDILGDRRVALHTQALIDIGLWDLAGKRAGQPLGRLWGNHCEDRPVIVVGAYYDSKKQAEDYGTEALDLQNKGYGGLKMKVGGLSPEEDAARVKAVREACGEDFIIAADANQGWSYSEALEFIDLVEDLNLLWFEEPVHWENDRAEMAKLKAERSIPICGAQSELSYEGAKALMDMNAIDYCNLHAGYVGGMTPWLKMAELASKQNVRVANTGEPQLSLQMMTAFAHGSPIEVYQPDRDPVFYHLVVRPEEIAGGRIKRPQAVGWGYDLDYDFIEEFKVLD
jgi:D-galactarolactone cycloisomerase